MIYLLDDTYRKNNLVDLDLENPQREYYKKVVLVDEITNQRTPGDLSHLEFLVTADAILLHSSFLDAEDESLKAERTTTNVTRIKTQISQFGEKIPLVLFSNGLQGVTYDPWLNPNYVMGINKDLFYERLPKFLEVYIKHKKVDFRFLAYNKKETIDIVVNLSRNLFSKLNQFRDDELITDSILEIIELHKLLQFFRVCEDSRAFIIETIVGRVTKSELLNNIRHIFDALKHENEPSYDWR